MENTDNCSEIPASEIEHSQSDLQVGETRANNKVPAEPVKRNTCENVDKIISSNFSDVSSVVEVEKEDEKEDELVNFEYGKELSKVDASPYSAGECYYYIDVLVII